MDRIFRSGCDVRWVLILATWIFGLLPPAALAAEGDYLWIEGESATTQNMLRQNWYDSVKKNQLSGKDWLSNFGSKVAEATFKLEIPKDGTYAFWVRANPVAGPLLSYKLGNGEYVAIDLSKNRENTNIASDDKPDMRFIAWIKVGDLPLKKGPLDIGFKMHSGNNNHGGLDCFVLSAVPFTPNGLVKPGQKLNLAATGTWSFEPDTDTFDAKKAMIDLRSLNEKVAGENGYWKVTPDGDLKNAKGQIVRLWCANTGVQERNGLDDLKQHAKFLAKRGVNMVRHHGHINPEPNQQITQVNEKQIDALQKLVAIMKEEGIYTTFSPFWGISSASASWGIEGHANGSLYTLVFWDPTLQKAYKGWLKEALTRPNPYEKNKLPLSKDPALAILQIQNEDSFLFWTAQNLKGPVLARLQTIYDSWRKEKGKAPSSLAIRFWELGNPTQDHKDTMQFFTETMRKFNAEIGRYLKEELGCSALVNAGNWRTANQVKLLDLERYSYTANPIIGVNRYVGPGLGCDHLCPGQQDTSGYLVKKGDFFQDQSALLNPGMIPTTAKQVTGLPYIISESTWVPPMSYQSEGAFLVSVYSSLNGMDGYYWFALGDIGFDRTLSKWGCATPSLMGGWPAAALLFRKDYVKRGVPAVHEERSLEDMYNLCAPIISEEAGFDPNRDTIISPKSSIKNGVDPLAYFIGPVEVTYAGDPVKSTVTDLKAFIDVSRKTVKSSTGEILLDYGNGVCTLNAPAAQGATGYLAKVGEIKLGAITIKVKNDYATVLVVSIDGKPLAESAKILLQITTRCRPYGWKETDGVDFKSRDGKASFKGKRVDDTGGYPWNVWNTEMSVSVRNAKLTKATLLDANFYPMETKVESVVSGGVLTVTPPPNGMYLVLE
ncbi:MAG TPA: hypothetical protein DCZ94_06495 [Lentisphaeria bacterium]|nr:MAG: hypothetical protein A2X48_10885 [Lentisphaerae bacterium GWF2_49_21]HBC86585.1 hypothetical protein [Lentisphaeria bacterium]